MVITFCTINEVDTQVEIEKTIKMLGIPAFISQVPRVPDTECFESRIITTMIYSDEKDNAKSKSKR